MPGLGSTKPIHTPLTTGRMVVYSNCSVLQCSGSGRDRLAGGGQNACAAWPSRSLARTDTVRNRMSPTVYGCCLPCLETWQVLPPPVRYPMAGIFPGGGRWVGVRYIDQCLNVGSCWLWSVRRGGQATSTTMDLTTDRYPVVVCHQLSTVPSTTIRMYDHQVRILPLSVSVRGENDDDRGHLQLCAASTCRHRALLLL